MTSQIALVTNQFLFTEIVQSALKGTFISHQIHMNFWVKQSAKLNSTHKYFSLLPWRKKVLLLILDHENAAGLNAVAGVTRAVDLSVTYLHEWLYNGVYRQLLHLIAIQQGALCVTLWHTIDLTTWDVIELGGISSWCEAQRGLAGWDCCWATPCAFESMHFS